jgi:hypothetical protein
MVTALRLASRGSPDQPSICVSHSLFLREFFRRYISQDMVRSQPFCRDLTMHKVGNAQVVKVVLDFGSSHSHKDCRVESAKPVFGMQFVRSAEAAGRGGRGFPWCCFPAAAAHDDSDEEETDEASQASPAAAPKKLGSLKPAGKTREPVVIKVTNPLNEML